MSSLGGNGSGQGNETEDEDHEFFDAMEEGISTTMDDNTHNSFVMKVPVSILIIYSSFILSTQWWCP